MTGPENREAQTQAMDDPFDGLFPKLAKKIDRWLGRAIDQHD